MVIFEIELLGEEEGVCKNNEHSSWLQSFESRDQVEIDDISSLESKACLSTAKQKDANLSRKETLINSLAFFFLISNLKTIGKEVFGQWVNELGFDKEENSHILGVETQLK